MKSVIVPLTYEIHTVLWIYVCYSTVGLLNPVQYCESIKNLLKYCWSMKSDIELWVYEIRDSSVGL